MAISRGQITKVIIISILAVLITTFILLMVFKVQIFSGPTFYIRFDHVGSLTVGGVVRTGGVRIGTVSNIDIDKSDFKSVIVTAMLYPGYKVKRNSKFLVQSGSLIGDQYIEVIPGESDRYIQEGEIFEGEPIKGIDSILASSDTLIKDLTISMHVISEMLQENEGNINQTLKNVREATESLNAYLSDKPNGEPSLLKKMYVVFENLEKSTTELNKLLESANSGESAISLLNEKETRADLQTTLGNLKKISDSLASVSAGLQTILEGVVGTPTPAPTPSPGPSGN